MKKVALLWIALMALLPLSAQIRGNNIVVTVQPDHQDWTYQTGQKARFTVNVLKSGTLMDIDSDAGDL